MESLLLLIFLGLVLGRTVCIMSNDNTLMQVTGVLRTIFGYASGKFTIIEKLLVTYWIFFRPNKIRVFHHNLSLGIEAKAAYFETCGITK